MRKTALTFATATLMLLGGCATPYMAARAAEKDRGQNTAENLYGKKYVALGASFSAGPGIPPPKPGAPVRCGQSLSSYPTLVAEKFGMVLVDRSCSGARTDHVTGPWNEISPQIDAVTPDTRLITINIGGNDDTYVGNMFTSTCLAAAALDPVGKTRSCAAIRVPTEADYAALEARMTGIAQSLRARAPNAKIVFVQYLTLIPETLCAATPIRAEDAPLIREQGRRLAEITGRVAQTNGAVVVEMNQASLGHTPCDAESWAIGFPPGYDGKQGLQWHPSLAGMKATADGIAYWLSETQGQVMVGDGSAE